MPFLVSSRYLWRVWLAQVRASLIREMEFRVNFFSGLIRQAAWLLTFVFLIEVIFQNTTSLAGWSQPEVLIVLALSRLIEGAVETLFGRNWANFPELVRSGGFDFILTKPVPAQLLVAFNRFRFLNLGNVLAGLGLLVYALFLLGHLPSLLTWLTFLFLLGVSFVIYYSLLTIIAASVFFFEAFGAFPALYGLISDPLTVPFSVFPSGLRIVLTYLLPLAFIVFVPAKALTGRLRPWQLLAAVSLGAVFFLLAQTLWRLGLRRYTSASS
jgi:ABC-2 type transport system permease protein